VESVEARGSHVYEFIYISGRIGAFLRFGSKLGIRQGQVQDAAYCRRLCASGLHSCITVQCERFPSSLRRKARK
jgi:hypothetical protein